MNKLTYRQFYDALPASKRGTDALWTRIALRPLSMPLGWGLYRLGFSANAVSLIGLILALPACILLSWPHDGIAIAGAVALNIVALLDCVDGNIARASGKTGPGGDWIDATVGYAVYALMPLALGFGFSLVHEGAWGAIVLLLGALASSLNLYSRLVFQKYEYGLLEKNMAGVAAPAAVPRSKFMKRVSADLGLGGIMMPALIVALYISVEAIFLGFYALLYSLVAAWITISRIRKVM